MSKVSQEFEIALKFNYNFMRKIVDYTIIWMIEYNLAPERYYLQTIKGCKSGLPRSKPVALVEEEGQRWLIVPYSDVNWVRNARPTNKVSLSRGRNSVEFRVTELSLKESTPILKRYVNLYAVTRPYFDAKPESMLAEFEKKAHLHHVFKLQKSFDG